LGEAKLLANFQVQVLSSLFFRNKGCLHHRQADQRLYRSRLCPAGAARRKTASCVIDAALFGEDDLLRLFSFARAYFMVDMEIPSAYVQFLRSMMPRKPRNEMLQRAGAWPEQGKTLFYRDLLAPPAATVPTGSASRPVSRAW